MNEDTFAIFFVLTLLNFFDKYLTALTVKELNFDHPKLKAKQIVNKHELNPIGRWVINTLGLGVGMFIFLITTEILILLILVYREPSIAQDFLAWGMLIGGLSLVNFIHLHNLNVIDENRRKELIRLRKRRKHGR